MMTERLDRVALRPSWRRRLGGEFEHRYMLELRGFLVAEKEDGRQIYPKGKDIFAAMNLLAFEDVKVVIIGQDPYHGPGQAHGLCFSVMPGVLPPPSLKNIFKEIEADLGIPPCDHGDLTSWAEQGVLLLNSVLTVEQYKAASHRGKGWERFTDALIASLARERSGLVFLLWGGYAQKKGTLIDTERHLVLRSVHPSPLSAYRGFFGNKHFSRTNLYLAEHAKKGIHWGLPTLSQGQGGVVSCPVV